MLGNEEDAWQLELDGDYGINYECNQTVLSLKTAKFSSFPTEPSKRNSLKRCTNDLKSKARKTKFLFKNINFIRKDRIT